MSAPALDLTSQEVTTTLLLNPIDWRERAVETFRLGSAEFVTRERSLQCRCLRALLQADPSAGTALVVLPLGLLPKQPLVDLDVKGPLGQTILLRRPEIAVREAALVENLTSDAGLDLGHDVRTLLPLLLGFTDGNWRAVRGSAPRRSDRVKVYLNAGLGVAPSPSQLRALFASVRRVTQVLDPYNDSPPEIPSAVESPFLVVPQLVEEGHVGSLDEAVDMVDAYSRFVQRAGEVAGSEPSAAGDLLTVLTDYGRYWEMLVHAEVPLDRPFTVTYSHLDPAPVRGLFARIDVNCVVADAESNHVVILISDPGTRIQRVDALKPRGRRELAYMAPRTRANDEMHTFYVSENDRDFRVTLQTQLGVLRRVALANIVLFLLTGLASTALLLRAPRTLGELAVSAGPTAAVAGLLVLREPSTLASRLRVPYTLIVILGVMLLAGVSVWRFTGLP